MPEVERLIAGAERKLDGIGRLLVRYSGTEMLARVMVEGEDEEAIVAIAREIGGAIGKRPALLEPVRARTSVYCARFERAVVAARGFDPSAFRYAFTVRVRPM